MSLRKKKIILELELSGSLFGVYFFASMTNWSPGARAFASMAGALVVLQVFN